MSNSQQPLSDVLYWFSLEEDKPTAALVDEYRARFPEYAEAITQFAIELAVDALGPDIPPLDVDTVVGPPSSVVMRSISEFQNALYQAKEERRSDDVEASSKVASDLTVNPFSSLDSTDFRRLARELGANSIFIAKLRDRLIVPETIPIALTQRVARELDVSADLVMAHFCAKPARGPTAVYYKAVDKPVALTQERFEEAVRTSGLTPEQQTQLLEL